MGPGLVDKNLKTGGKLYVNKHGSASTQGREDFGWKMTKILKNSSIMLGF